MDEKEILDLLQEVIELLEASKPGDRSELDRAYAIAKTDAEKLHAFWAVRGVGAHKERQHGG